MRTTCSGRQWPSELTVSKDPINGAKVLYTADPQAYGQVFIVDVPEWDAMPDRAAVTKNKEV